MAVLISSTLLPALPPASFCCSSDLRSSLRRLSFSPRLGWWSWNLDKKRDSDTTWISASALPVEDMAQANGAELPDLLTEFMVDMKCEGCVKAVRSKLEPLDGVKSVDVDLGNQVVRVLGTATIKNLSSALEQTNRKARLIGQGFAENFVQSAAVAEFKGPQFHGVVRFAQVSMELARIEASLSGLSPGLHGWSINVYGDLRRGAATTGPIYNPDESSEALGDLGVLEANEKGDAYFSGMKAQLIVGDLIGRALVLYEGGDKSKEGIAASVIARSAGVGENYKKLCTCDGTVIWESTNNDYVKS